MKTNSLTIADLMRPLGPETTHQPTCKKCELDPSQPALVTAKKVTDKPDTS